MIQFSLVTLLGTKINQEVYEVILPTSTGDISVFPGHEPLVTLARPGVISVRHKKVDPNDMLEFFATSGGVIEIDQDSVKVLVDEADHGDDIIEAESQKALERAMKLQAEASDAVSLEEAHKLVDRHQVRLKVAELRRHSRRRPQ